MIGQRIVHPRTWLWLLLAAFAMLLLAPALASAGAPIRAFSVTPTSTQAGGHPDLAVSFRVGTFLTDGENDLCRCNAAKEVIAELPAGFIGDPHAAPQCTPAELSGLSCPPDSQVGAAVVAFDSLSGGVVTAVYNVTPTPSQPGLLAFIAPIIDVPIYIEIGARTEGDYGLETRTFGIPRSGPPSEVTVITWGVPASPEHDALRFPFEGLNGGLSGQAPLVSCGVDPTAFVMEGIFPGNVLPPDTCTENHYAGLASNSPEQPFLSAPTTCGPPATTSLDVIAYDLGTDHAEAPFPATTGCGLLSFDPSLSAQPTSREADSPSGLDVDLEVPQFQSPTVPSPSEIRATTMTLPPGFTVNPNAADGKSACADQAARFGSRAAAECPELAKVGTLSIDSSALPGLLRGYAYLGQPLPGNRYRAFLVADGFGLHIKLSGTVTPDPSTGQLVVSFRDLPQAPFQEFNLHVFGGERGVFATPTRCGAYPVRTEFVPWDSELENQTSTQLFTIDSGPGGTPCPGSSRPFDPTFAAGSADNSAGGHSTFSLDLSRRDGDQFLGGLTVVQPPGFAALLSGVPDCPEAAIAKLSDPLSLGVAEQAAPACPASQIGVVSAGAGAGSKPFSAPGRVYLAGPYKGAPLSLLVVVPAVSGPFDLGNVAVRAAINVDRTTGRVSTTSDPLPQIVAGVPLRARAIRVEINRPDFALNPTNCSPLATTATVTGTEGAVASRVARYQVANCANLPFAPRLSLKLKGRTGRTGHPVLSATLTKRPGEANLARSVVRLPHALFLDNDHIGTVCTRVQFSANSCPAAARYGYARATTPIFEQPLEGPVYLRSSSHELPDLVADLRGRVDFELAGRIDTVGGGIRTTFEGIPDVPVSKFTLSMKGGDKGLLINSTDLCAAHPAALVTMVGQNGKRVDSKVRFGTSCAKKTRRPRRSARGAR
jgi:hypothetical protein